MGGRVQAERTGVPGAQQGRDHETGEVAQREQVQPQGGLLLRQQGEPAHHRSH